MSGLRHTPLHALHLELGARMVPFAGYDMPVQFPLGVLKEHLHTRSQAGLFDVSHMGQLRLMGARAPLALETLVPVDLVDLGVNQQRYALLTDASGGILDDLMVTRISNGLQVVVNAACKEDDTRHVRSAIGAQCDVIELKERALLALQGPRAAFVLQQIAPELDFASWTFMTARECKLLGTLCFVARSGYTGEDGFEISVPNEAAENLARALLRHESVQPIGLGARDSLRLEAGLCLYGHDIDTSTTPVEASLTWAISKARRAGGARAGGFPGAERVLEQIATGSDRKRVGLLGVEKTPVREGAPLQDASGQTIGRVTSGGFGPSLGGVVAIGYVPKSLSALGSEVFALVRERRVPMRVAKTPFVPNHYYRG